MALFGKSDAEAKAEQAWDVLYSEVMSQYKGIIAENDVLLSLSKSMLEGQAELEAEISIRFAYYALVAGLDIIYQNSIVAFRPGSRQSLQVARALRRRFEVINKHLMLNLDLLWRFQKTMHEVQGDHKLLLPGDFHGAWVIAGFKQNTYIDFANTDLINACKQVSAWLNNIIGDVFDSATATWYKSASGK